MAYKFLSTILGIDANFTGKSSIGTLIASTDYSDALLSLSKSNGYTTQEIRGVNQSTLVLTSGVTANSTTPAIELFNSYNFGIKFIGGTTGGFSNYPMYYYAGNGAGTGDYTMFQVGGSERMRIVGTNVLIGTTTNAGFRLDVNGTTRSQGKLTITTGGAEITGLITGYSGLEIYGGEKLFSAGTLQFFNSANNSIAQMQYVNANGLQYNINSQNIGGVKKGIELNSNLIAAANNDVLVGLDITPTFTNGAFTGVTNWGLRVASPIQVTYDSTSVSGLNLNTTVGTVGIFNNISFTTSGTLRGAFGINNQSGEFRWNSTSGGYYPTIYSNGLERMRIPTTGNVLVGTTTDAGYKLDVNGTGRFQSNLTITKGASNYFTFDANTNTNDLFIQFFKAGAFETRMYTKNNYSVGALTIQSGLSVTNSAGDLSGFSAGQIGVNFGVLAITNTGGDAQTHIVSPSGYSNYISFRENGVSDRGILGYQNGTSYMQVRTNGATNMSNGTFSTAFFSSGNVGIGTTTDAGYKLDVNGTGRFTPNGSAISAFYIQTHGTYVNRTRFVVGATDGANNNSGLQFTASTGTGKTYINGWDDGGTSQYDIVISSNGGRVQFGTDSSSVASSQVTINSTTRGFLPPRMTATQRTAISTPAVGLIVYQTDSVEGVYVYTSGGWKSLTMV